MRLGTEGRGEKYRGQRDGVQKKGEQANSNSQERTGSGKAKMVLID